MKNKLKSNKAFAKRFKFTASGKVKFKRAALRHCLGHRRTKVKVKLRAAGHLANTGDMRRVEARLPYGR